MFCFLYTRSGLDMVRGEAIASDFLRVTKVDNHERFCDDILSEVSVLVVRAKSPKSQKCKSVQPLLGVCGVSLWFYGGGVRVLEG